MPVQLLFRSTVQMLDSTLDPATIDWVYECDTLGSVTPLLAADVSVAIQHFYFTAAAGSTLAYQKYLGPSVNPTPGVTWTCYNITGHLDGSPHGSPINSNSYAPLALSVGSGGAPEGVAAVLSFRRDYGTDVEFQRDPVTHKITSRPRGQDRGRIYLGPFHSGPFMQDATTGRTKFAPLFITNMLAQLQGSMQITDSGSNIWQFRQWSRKKASVAPLVQSWMDDRPDYQRRRADQSTSRTTHTVTYP